MRIFLGFVGLGLALSACSGGDAGGNSADVTETDVTATDSASLVAEGYQKSFGRAWDRAGDGRSPTSGCAGVFGRAVGLLKTTATDGQPRADAITALNACYVLAMARYVDVKLASDDQDTEKCMDMLRALPVHRRSLGGFLDDVGEDKAAYDSRLNDLIGDKLRSACPDSAAVLLGG
ncbi:MAG: hypothetical protein V7676_18430 [Parasphingorhabdus sp.]|uniref:hypothetical protein n=1 Tax=Parasphingorhabdus sp. TaxID=2709688 RepID=UPI003001FD29